MRLDPYARSPRQFVLVVDTDALLSSIENHCRTGRVSRIGRMCETYRRLPVFAADHVFGEVYAGFARMEQFTGTSAVKMRRLFDERYLPGIRWVNVDDLPVWDQRVTQVSNMDVDDVPTAKLATLLGPCLVLSGDKSLRRPGFAPSEWRPAAGHAVTVVEGRDLSDGAATVVGLPVYGGIAGTVKLGNRFGLPWFASVAILAGGLYLLFAEPRRRSALRSRVGPFFEAMFEQMAEAERQDHVGRAGVKEAMCRPGSEVSARQMVATVLARESEPLLAAEVQERMLDLFDGRLVPKVADVREILRRSPEFVRVERYRFQLGRRSRPALMG